MNVPSYRLQFGDLDDVLRPLGELDDLAGVLVRSRHRLLIFLQPLVESPVAVFEREMPEGLGDLELAGFCLSSVQLPRNRVFFSQGAERRPVGCASRRGERPAAGASVGTRTGV